MKVTPLDIRRKEFKRSVRGYADEEVDLFLDEVADELERLSQESTELLERLRRQEEQFAGYQQLRDALEKALVSAQIQAEETRANARKEAELVLRDAEVKARGIVGESYAEVQRVQQSLVQLKHLEEDFRFKFQSLLEGHLKLVAEPPLGMAASAAVIGAPAIIEPAPPTAPVSPMSSEASMAPMAAPEAPAPAAPPEAAVQMPFVVPAAFEEVPEYPVVAAPVRPESPVGPETAAVSAIATPHPAVPGAPQAPAAVEPPAVKPTPASAVITEPVLQPPAGLLWPDDRTATHADDTAAFEQGSAPGAADVTEDQTRTFALDSPGTVGDESVTLSGNEDPLRGFFFSPQDENSGDAGQGGKSKPRDFEW